MAEAKVSSIDAIEAFRAALIVYASKMKPLLEDASDEALRTREWLSGDRRMFWENQMKVRRRKLEEAEQAVFSSRVSNLREVSSAEQAAVRRAKAALTEAEDKLRLVKRWSQEFDNLVEPQVKELESLHTELTNELPKAAAFLANLINSLHAYANVGAPVAVEPPAAEARPAAEGAGVEEKVQ
jgi:hypothetical protein